MFQGIKSIFYLAVGLLFFFGDGQVAQAASDIQPITFLDSPDPVPASGIVNYYIVVQNNDPDDPAIDPHLEVTVPSGFQFYTSDDPACDYNVSGRIPSLGDPNIDKVVCDWASPIVLSRTINLEYIASDEPDTYEVIATASALADANPDNNVENNITDVEESADIELISKTSSPNPVVGGDIVSYEFVVRNNGPFAADSLTLTDELPTGVTFFADNANPATGQDGSWNCSASGQDVSCTSASLAVASTSTFSFRVRATRDSAGYVTNAATVTSLSPEPNPDNNTKEDTLQITVGTDMSVAKRVDTSPVISGSPVNYTLTVANLGGMTANTVVVTDTLPTDYTAISASSIPSGWSCDVNQAAFTVTCQTASMAGGTSVNIGITATVVTGITATTTHQNGAIVSTTTIDPIASNDAVVVPYSVLPDSADLHIAKNKGPSPVVQGSNVTSTITVTNHGPRAADLVEVADELDLGETFVSVGGDWTCSATPSTSSPGGVVICTYDNAPLASGATTTALTIVTAATEVGNLTNIACTGGSSTPGGTDTTEPAAGDLDETNNCSGPGDGTILSTLEEANITVDKYANNYDIGTSVGSFSYTIDIVNSGGSIAESVDFRDIIPQYVSAGTGGRGATVPVVTTVPPDLCAYDAVEDGPLVSCNVGDIGVGEMVQVIIEVPRPMADGLRTNTASAYSTRTGDPDRRYNEDSVNVNVDPQTDIEVTQKNVTYVGSSAGDPIVAETIATYTIGVRNNGPSEATGVVLTDLFSGAGFELLSATVGGGGGSCDGLTPTLTCSLPDMDNGDIVYITVRIRPDHYPNADSPGPAPDPWFIANTATVSMNPAIDDSNTSNNWKSQSITVINGSADLAVEKNESPVFIEPVRFDPAQPVDKNYIVYEVVVDNRGPSLANHVQFKDNVLSVNPLQGTPQQLRFVRDTENPDGSGGISNPICSAPAPNPFPLNNGPDIDCVLENPLEVGAQYTRYLVFEVLTEPNAFSGDSYKNSVTVTADEPDPKPGNNTEGETTTVRTVVDLGIVKTSTKTTTDPNRVEVEELFDFTLEITNKGPGISPGATVQDNLPDGMVLTAAPSILLPNPNGITASCTGGAGDTTYTCSLGQMTPNEFITLRMPVKLISYPTDPEGIITNSATVTGIAPEPEPGTGYDPLLPNTSSHTVGVLKPAVVGDKVWLDRDADGIQDGGESGINGITVNLLDNANSQIATTTTANGGLYSFTINSAGSYRVEFIKQAGDFSSPQDAGGDDSADSDAEPSDGRTALIPVTYGDNINTIDAGFYEQLSLGNRVWLDRDADGIQDGDELSLAGVTVQLLDDGLTVIATTTTDLNGNYLFSELEPGNYSVQISPPAWVGYLAGPQQVLNPNNNSNNDSNIASSPSANSFRSNAITLSSRVEPTNDGDSDNNTNLTLDFGLVLPASVGNRVWLDENSDGIQDAGEPGIANVTVQLKQSDGKNIITTVTDTNGGYLFKGYAPGTYYIEVDADSLPADLSQTSVYPTPGADFSNQDQSTGFGYEVTLTSGGENLTADFGYNWSPSDDVNLGENTGAIGDRVWIDTNGNGIQDASEMGVSGVELTLLGSGPDGIFGNGDDISDTTSTGPSGKYIFDDLAAGSYTVEISDSSLASHDILTTSDYSQTGDPDHFGRASSSAPTGTAGDNLSTLPVVLGPGDTFINVDFGYQPLPSAGLLTIGDLVWFDLNSDGVIDTEEPGIAGVTVGLQNGAGDFIATTTTATDGTYLFTDLPDEESYTVVIVDSRSILAGLSPTFDADDGTTDPNERSLVSLSGSDDLFQDFGYAPINPGLGSGAIGDTIFLDRNNSLDFDEGEGLENIRVFLKDSVDNVLATTYTDENGIYLFTGLETRLYTVEVDTTTLPGDLTNTVDPDNTFDSTSQVNLVSPAKDLDQDFGYYPATGHINSIGNFIWQDTNGDGIYQSNGLDTLPATADDEIPLAGVTVQIYRDGNANGLIDPSDPLYGSSATDTSGLYLFTGLPDGSYLVDITDEMNVLTGYFHSLGTPGLNNNSQPDYYGVAVADGEDNLTADFGYYFTPGTMGNLVWRDENVNGLYDDGIDTLLDGVTVYLDIEYPDGTTITVETMTDGSGVYTFSNLLVDEDYNGMGPAFGTNGDDPLHSVRTDETTLPANITAIYPTRVRNTDSTTIGGTAADDEDVDLGSDDPTGEVGYPPQGSADITNDFGYFAPGSIGDTIWNDQNNDGVFDSGEGLVGVTVQLTPPANVNLGGGLGVAVTEVTATGGAYLFGGLPPGNYTVTVIESTLPSYLQGHNTVDPDGGNNSTATLTLAIAQENLDQDFAYFFPSSIGDYVWDDSNGNGIQDNNEAGHQGVTVQLLDAGGQPVENPALPGVDYIVQTGPDGEYLFENLLPGSYQVYFVLPNNNSFTLQDSGADDAADSDIDSGTGRVDVTLAANEVNLTIDAGLFGAAINIEKSTNGVDADNRPGVTLDTGDSITWEYVVTNTGSVPLNSVAVTDDRLGVIDCPQTTLTSGATMTCTATGTATSGQYVNIGSVIGSPEIGPAVTDSDPSHYLAGEQGAAIDIEKYTNGEDADIGTGPIISVGEPVEWTYIVTNIGMEDLSEVTVTDNIVGNIDCPETVLAVEESMICTVLGTATAGQYANIGTVTALSESETPVSDVDPSHYFGSSPGEDFAAVDIEKATNGFDADIAPGPHAEIGSTVAWTYVITNTGDVDLTNVTVTDSQLPDTAISCPNDGNTDNSIVLLTVGSSATCMAEGIATAGQYTNTGSVIGTPPTGPNVVDSDPSHYFGSTGGIDIEKYTNGIDADTEPGPTIKVKKEVVWTYVVTNSGPFPLTNVVVTDDQNVEVSCPQDTLAIGEAITCSGNGIAIEGQYENLGSVTALTPNLETVTDSDPSHYLGTAFLWEYYIPILTKGCPPVPDFCYMVADGDNEGSNNSALFSYVFSTETMELINRLGVGNVETVTLSLDGKTIYAADAGVFGIIDPTPGLAYGFVPIDADGVGYARGAAGTILVEDIDGMAFDPTTSLLYASVRYGDGMGSNGSSDLLIKINPESGRIIADGFGAGVDYVVIDTASIGQHDMDDIAFNESGRLFGIAAISGSGGDHLVVINKATGATTDHGALDNNGRSVQDMEGLTFYNSRDLYGTTGLDFSVDNTDNTLYKINKRTGKSEPIIRLDNSFDGYIPRDFEAITCFPVCR